MTPDFDSVQSAFTYLESFTNLEKKWTPDGREYRLDRMRVLLGLFDNPEKDLSLIHIAGSKGKGSTAAFVASILGAAGYSTGIYASPHVCDYRERIRLSNRYFRDSLYIDAIGSIKRVIDSRPPSFKPTTFELLTLAAYMVFTRAACDYCVIETGLGGRLDCTNTIQPVMSIITSIELEHTAILGNTHQEIAAEKAGIIKQNTPVCLGMVNDEAAESIHKTAKKRSAPIFTHEDCWDAIEADARFPFIQCRMKNTNGRVFNARLRLAGAFQPGNAALAVQAVTHILPGLDTEVIENGLSTTVLPARCQVIDPDIPVILDSAHTATSISNLVSTLVNWGFTSFNLLFGCADDKDYRNMASQLQKHIIHCVVTTPGHFKQSNPRAVYESFRSLGVHSTLVKTPGTAYEDLLNISRQNKTPLVITGSFYLAGEILAHINRNNI